MKMDQNPFPFGLNMVEVSLIEGKTKVLTSAKAKESGLVNSKVQLSADACREDIKRSDSQRSRYEQGESSKIGAS